MMKITLSLAFVFVASLLHADPPQVFDYEIPGHPAGEATCASVAEGVGLRLAATTGMKIYKTQGYQAGKQRCDLVISYLAEKALPLVSTAPDHPSLIMVDRFNYNSIAECGADALALTSRFKEATGLEPIVSYCYSTNLFQEGAIYILRIDALGKAKLWPRYFSLPRAFDKADELIEQVATAVDAKGGQIFRIARNRYPQYENTSDGIFYFSPINLVVETLDPPLLDKLLYKTDEDCDAQIPDAKKAIAALEADAASTLCVARKNHSGKFSRLIAVLTRDGAVPRSYYPHGGEYDSLDACLSDRARMIVLQKELGKDARAGLCTWYRDLLQNHFKMVLYSL